MSEMSSDQDRTADGSRGDVARHYNKEFWGKESSKFLSPHHRLKKVARIINRTTGVRECDLLDVGCGPGTLMHLLRPNIHYHGIDLFVSEPAPHLVEADLLESPIAFGDKRFDIVVAQGVFEYLGDSQSQKFAEISDILRPDGTFIVSYSNFGHRKPEIYGPYSNVQSFEAFRASLSRHFDVRRYLPTSHNWNHGQPTRKLVRVANMYLNMNIPFITPRLAVEYFFICAPLGKGSLADQRSGALPTGPA